MSKFMARFPLLMSASAATATNVLENSPTLTSQWEHNDTEEQMEEDHGSQQEEIQTEIDATVVEVPLERDELGRLKIHVKGPTFDRDSALVELRNIIHFHYDGDWIRFSDVPSDVKRLWFEQFARKFYWDEGSFEAVRSVWRLKCGDHLRNTFLKARKPDGRKPAWISVANWARMRKMWETDEKFNRMSKSNKENRAKEGKNGFAAYSGGCISITRHVEKFKKVNRKAPTMRQLMEITYKKKNGEWSGSRVVKTMDAYSEMLEKYKKDNSDASGDNMALYVTAAGGVKKGRVFGLGAQVFDIPPELLEKYSFAGGNSVELPMVNQRGNAELQKAQAEMEQKMKAMQGVIEGLSTQLSSLLQQQSQQPAFQLPSAPAQSFSQSMMQAAMLPQANLASSFPDFGTYSSMLNPNYMAMLGSQLSQGLNSNSFVTGQANQGNPTTTDTFDCC